MTLVDIVMPKAGELPSFYLPKAILRMSVILCTTSGNGLCNDDSQLLENC